MKKWYLPLTVLGLSGLSALFVSATGRRMMHRAITGIGRAPQQLDEWNQAALNELGKIQQTLDQLSEALGASNLGSANMDRTAS